MINSILISAPYIIFLKTKLYLRITWLLSGAPHGSILNYNLLETVQNVRLVVDNHIDDYFKEKIPLECFLFAFKTPHLTRMVDPIMHI